MLKGALAICISISANARMSAQNRRIQNTDERMTEAHNERKRERQWCHYRYRWKRKWWKDGEEGGRTEK